MNLKYYLRGLGSGIIIATTVLAITYAIINRDANIIQKARELGMVFSEETKENQTKDQPSTSEDRISSSEDNTSKTDESTSGEENTSKDNTNEDVTTEETTTEEATIEEETTTAESTYTITIRRGMTSESVAMIFKNFGVIDDQEEFNAYLVDNGYAGSIRVGVYEVIRGDSYENLAKIITGAY